MRAVLSILLLCALALASAFKEEDFKKCKDSAFCTRMRGANATADLHVVPGSLAVRGAAATARLASRADPRLALDFALTAHDGILRLHVNEAGAAGAARYQVQDVLVPSAAERRADWAVAARDGAGATLRAGGAEARLSFDPVRLDVADAATGEAVLSWNAGGRFAFERHRAEGKQDGDPDGWWDEPFKSHRDSKPRGPEAIAFDVRLGPGFSHVYGLPERAGPLPLRPTAERSDEAGVGTLSALRPLSEPYRLYNLDVFEYLPDSPFGLYGSVPLLVAAGGGGAAAGVFWLNAAEMYVDVVAPPNGTAAGEPADGSISTVWMAEAGVLDVFVLLGPSPAAVSAQLARLAGGAAMPQAFALGYHQCRWNYRDEADVAAVDAGFDEHAIPYDVLWLDIEHTDGKRYFTWDAAYFPNPAQMQRNLSARGRKMVTIIDPHIKRDAGWPLFAGAEAAGLFVKDKDGADFNGWCWPGSSSYLDLAAPAAREWWAGRFALDAYNGSTPSLYVWNDMNEPSVFNGPEITMPKDATHAPAGAPGRVEHRALHNLYGLYFHAATAEGLRRRGEVAAGPDGDRPFVLSRAFFAGTQRHGAVWTGDNAAEWAHLDASVPMLLSCSLGGISFVGADVGGFFGNPDAQLATRWYQAAALTPFFRGHAHLEAARREPWLFGGDATARIRAAIAGRYRLLPYLYTLFAAANGTGAPPMRPLWWQFPGEPALLGEDRTFMLGPDLLAAPVLAQDAASVRVVLPHAGGAPWYDAATGVVVDASQHGGGGGGGAGARAPAVFERPVTMDDAPAYLRGGGVLPLRERPRRSTAAAARDPLTLVVALGAGGAAQGDLYLDDGRSYAHRRGEYAYRRFSLAPDAARGGGALVLRAAARPRGAEELGLPPSGAPRACAGAGAEGAAAREWLPLVDRVVFLGLPGGPARWAAAVEACGHSRPATAGPGPLYAGAPGLPPAALVVRRAGLPAGGDWALRLTPRGGGAPAATE